MPTPWKLAPIYINFMLNCHFSADPRETITADHWDSKAGHEVRVWLRAEGLIDDENRSTERGRAWVEFICQTPLPEAKWVMPERPQP
jgi:hypothetical protein